MKKLKRCKQFMPVLLTAIIILLTTTSTAANALANDVSCLLKSAENTELIYGDYIYRLIATSTDTAHTNTATTYIVEITGYKGNDQSITIPSQINDYPVTNIGSHAFYYCYSPKSITMPNITSIGSEAFSHCYSLRSIAMPNVTSVDSEAFSNCYSLTSITMPNVISIGSEAFSRCRKLTNITVPNVTSIGSAAFFGCSDLTNITIPQSVTSIGDRAFSSCESLTEIKVSENNNYYSDDNGVLFNKVKTILIQYPDGKEATIYSVPESVASIGSYAFSDCSRLSSVWIGENVTHIGDGAFNRITTIYGISGSCVETYAKENDIKFIAKSKEYAKLITKCDYDGDGILTVSDVINIQNILTSSSNELTEEQIALADINGDGNANLMDAYDLYIVTQ